MYQDDFDYLVKTVIIGDSGVGKTSIVNALTNKRFFQMQETTVGVDYGVKFVELSDSKIAVITCFTRSLFSNVCK